MGEEIERPSVTLTLHEGFLRVLLGWPPMLRYVASFNGLDPCEGFRGTERWSTNSGLAIANSYGPGCDTEPLPPGVSPSRDPKHPDRQWYAQLSGCGHARERRAPSCARPFR